MYPVSYDISNMIYYCRGKNVPVFRRKLKAYALSMHVVSSCRHSFKNLGFLKKYFTPQMMICTSLNMTQYAIMLNF